MSQARRKSGKKGEKFCKMQKKKARFWLAHQASFEDTNRLIVKNRTNKHTNNWKRAVYWYHCDTCDSKKAKTPGMRVRAHAREGVIIVLFTIHLLPLSSCFFPLLLGYPKTTRPLRKSDGAFEKNNPSFYEKQPVVLWKTSRRFMKRRRLLYFIISSL